MATDPPHPPQFDAAAKAKWRHHVATQMLALFLPLPLCFAISVIAVLYLQPVILRRLSGPTQTPGLILAAIVIAAIVGGGVLTMFLLRLLQRKFGMFCDACGQEFDREAYEFFVVRGECVHCLRRRTAEESAFVAGGDSAATVVDTSNPYAPPRTIERLPVDSAPVRVVHLNSPGTYLFLAAVFTLLGWVGLLVVIGKLALVRFGFPAWHPGQGELPPWLQREAQAARRALLKKYLIAGGIWLALFGLGFGLSGLLWPNAEPLARIFASHLACGAAFAFVFLVVLPYRSPRDRRAGVVVLGSPQFTECEVRLFPYGDWRSTPREFQFRTQGEEGILLRITQALTTERLFEATYPRVNPEGWNQVELPLELPAIAGCPSDQLEVKIYPRDRKPWMVRYEQSPPG